ncbi:MAG TPA: NADH-quinone oxidoreductase subunit H, partial [Trebonia sp.]
MSGHVLALDSTLSDFNTLIWWMVLLKVAIVFVFLLLTTIFMIWFERRVIGRMQNRPGPNRAGPFGLLQPIADALIFAADMYGVQLDQLAALTRGERAARAAAARWRELGYAETARLGPGPAWLWVTKAGLAACGLRYSPARPALSRLAHTRAVAAARMALEATSGYQRGAAFWRCERRIRSRHGVGMRQHLPDAEVHWPDGSPAEPLVGATDAPPAGATDGSPAWPSGG